MIFALTSVDATCTFLTSPRRPLIQKFRQQLDKFTRERGSKPSDQVLHNFAADLLEKAVPLIFPERIEWRKDIPDRCRTCFTLQFGQFQEVMKYLVENPHVGGPALVRYFQSADSAPDWAGPSDPLGYVLDVQHTLYSLVEVSDGCGFPGPRENLGEPSCGSCGKEDGHFCTRPTTIAFKFPHCTDEPRVRVTFPGFLRDGQPWVLDVEVCYHGKFLASVVRVPEHERQAVVRVVIPHGVANKNYIYDKYRE
ncbi:hypothetical protein B0T14DRAFT_568219 [Immersiella caudata]|uniref:Uncharacterized protein n=1 Tax=Immersiella caudata TaxID=314043 RepID=A0AA39WJU7_9PEZI|nr:hypothetical protein B0T14DRAFT_568219 [Immersiella caudata]